MAWFGLVWFAWPGQHRLQLSRPFSCLAPQNLGKSLRDRTLPASSFPSNCECIQPVGTGSAGRTCIGLSQVAVATIENGGARPARIASFVQQISLSFGLSELLCGFSLPKSNSWHANKCIWFKSQGSETWLEAALKSRQLSGLSRIFWDTFPWPLGLNFQPIDIGRNTPLKFVLFVLLRPFFVSVETSTYFCF